MADYHVTLTSAGAELLAKCLAGKTLRFTGVQLGDGEAMGAFEDITALASLKKVLPVSSIARTGTKANVKAVLDYTSITEDFQWKEVGLIAADPDTGGEVLYCYGNAGSKGDWITGGTAATAKSINLTALVSNLASVTAVIDNATIYAAADLSNVPATALAQKIREAVAGSLTAGDLGAVGSNQLGKPGGVATLDGTGKVPKAQIGPHEHSANDITSGTLGLVRGGTGAGTAAGARGNLQVGKTVWGNATFLPSGWTESDEVFTQTVSCPGAAASMRFVPDIRLLPSREDVEAAELQKEAFALLSDYGETGDGTLTLTTKGANKPQVAFTVMLLGEVV